MEPATHRRAERGPLRSSAGAKRKLGWEERKELRGGGVAGERGGVGGGARGHFQERVYFTGETQRAESAARSGGGSRVVATDHLRSVDVSCSFIHSFNKSYWTPMMESKIES